MCELDRSKLKKMIDKVLKGELEIDKDTFRTLTIAYENSVNFIELPTMVHPSMVRVPLPPPPKPMTITLTIENPDPNFIISVRGKRDIGNCVKELPQSDLFEKYRKRAERTDLKPFEIMNDVVIARDWNVRTNKE